IYLEVLKEPFGQFAAKFIGTLLYNSLKYNRRETRDNLEYLIGECEKDIPETVASIRNIMKLIEKGGNDNAYSELFNLSSILKKETGKPCVIILDEFHNLSSLGIKDPFKYFGKKIMAQKDTMYIVASSEVTSMQKILSEKLALLFGNFEKITLSGFNYETSRAFLRKKLPSVKINDELMDFIISFADGHPFYLDAISSKINELMGNLHFRMLTVSMAGKVLEELLFDSRGTLNQFFINLLRDLIDPGTGSCKETLIAIAHGLFKQREISKWTGCNNKVISAHLKILPEKNLIYASGGVYRFYDKVLKFWLKKVYHKRRRTLVDNIAEKAGNFRNGVIDMIKQFIDESMTDAAVRVKGLLESFNNEIVEIDTKKHRLTRFDKVGIIEENEKKYIIGYYKTKLYLVYISGKKIGENEILDFLGISLKYKPNLQRRIILSLGGIDMNAMLMAKETKTWIWGIETTNDLLDLFGKQKIIRVKE
ncbi:MAG: hypothetical protein U9R52_02295, partial [Candidatus Omnitrophota bacterium]|nr:hypothetical protein [Candidatus Omnitrophota bacterium]